MLTDAIGTRHTPVLPENARIVSLVPSITELLFDLGLANSVVGRTGFCIHPQPAVQQIAKVGGTKDVNLAKIRKLAPTHVILNIDENEKPTYESLREFVPHIIVTHPCIVSDNLALYRLLGALFSVEAAAAQLCERFEAAFAALPQATSQQVLYCIWQEPWMTVGKDTYITDMLSLIGWQTWQPASATQPLPRYPQFEWDDAGMDKVERILLSTEPYRFDLSHVQAVQQRTGRPVQLVDGEMLSWYGSRAIAGLQYLHALAQS